MGGGSGGGKGFRQPPRSGLHFWELLNGVGNCSAPGSTDLGASALPSTHPLSSGLWEGRPGGTMGLSGPPSVDACGCGPSRRLGLILFHSRPLDGD
ncbi:hypothetical protein ANANG_G00071770 [Anguilla anguilla]|uniref:Uncharacterized protein n=1 Tax=Anguilla anguilla TaxID=7936 RepID=A0A9D3MQT3_ANGAN|nr:hypothetical protein ANANG_G00071770 [Anguilla anguilla]